MMIRDVELPGRRGRLDVRCQGGVITEIGTALPGRTAERVIAGNGGALLPGLHDHHIHLYALAAARSSVHCGPPQVTTLAQLTDALRSHEGRGWIRGVGYHESVAGELTRWQLDRMVRDRPLKLQHRSGKLWMVNSLAARLLSLDHHLGLQGNDLDATGRPTGRLFRLDKWIRDQLLRAGQPQIPSLAGVSRELASYGVTGLTDASADNSRFTMEQFTLAARSGHLLQGLRVMGGEDLPDCHHKKVCPGERKVLLDENKLPHWDSLRAVFEVAHRQCRPVAVHCVTPTELVFALSVLQEVGPYPGDRIEHASLVPVGILPLLLEVGVRVVTQPGFIHERGDQYLRDIRPAEYDDLYRCQALLAHGIPLAGSTDAPYGDPDPWAAMRGAVNRRSRGGAVIGPSECLSPEQALAMFTSAADDPGGVSRRVEEGAVADLCLLNRRWSEASLRLRSEDVRMTIKDGQLIYHRSEQRVSRRQYDSTAA